MDSFVFFSILFVLGLCITPSVGGDEACSSKTDIALDQINLDFVWIEPAVVRHALSNQFLNMRREKRFRALEEIVTVGYKNATLTMVAVGRSTIGSKCLDISTGLADFAEKKVEDGEPLENMLTALALTLSRRPASSPASAPLFQSAQPTVRLIAMFAEYFYPGTYTSFKSDGSETCGAEVPSLLRIQELARDNGIELVLVTQDSDLVKYWKDHFENSVFLFPQGFLNDSNVGQRYLELRYNLTTFIRERSVVTACNRFKEFVKPRAMFRRTTTAKPETTEPTTTTSTSTTPTATVSIAPPPVASASSVAITSASETPTEPAAVDGSAAPESPSEMPKSAATVGESAELKKGADLTTVSIQTLQPLTRKSSAVAGFSFLLVAFAVGSAAHI